MITLAGEVIKKFRIVIVYFKVKFTPAVEYHIQKSNELRIQCFVLDSFVEHVVIEGRWEYLRNNTKLKDQDLCNIV